jgi:alkanesulfonate monooxygenase SsuD/methylene tetrahydromethanopterin reductase-like flavin-dependent oxidoreductase (luciferase family)
MSERTHDRVPALSLVASPTKRADVLELAREAERVGVEGIACPSLGGTMGLCTSLAHVTSTIRFWTSIQPLYYSHAVEAGNGAAHIHEVSGGRFGFGIGVSHAAVTKRLRVETGKPLADVEQYVADMRANERFSGALPPIYLATLRDRMLDLAARIADGAIWANASLAAIRRQVDRIRDTVDGHFFLANMIPTVIDDDLDAARAVHRRTLAGYAILPNYRNYWRQAGHAEQVQRFEDVIASTPKDELADRLRESMDDAWIDDCTISGSPSRVKDAFAAWRDTGVTPIAVMSSTGGGQVKAVREFFDLWRQ